MQPHSAHSPNCTTQKPALHSSQHKFTPRCRNNSHRHRHRHRHTDTHTHARKHETRFQRLTVLIGTWSRFSLAVVGRETHPTVRWRRCGPPCIRPHAALCAQRGTAHASAPYCTAHRLSVLPAPTIKPKVTAEEHPPLSTFFVWGSAYTLRHVHCGPLRTRGVAQILLYCTLHRTAHTTHSALVPASSARHACVASLPHPPFPPSRTATWGLKRGCGVRSWRPSCRGCRGGCLPTPSPPSPSLPCLSPFSLGGGRSLRRRRTR